MKKVVFTIITLIISTSVFAQQNLQDNAHTREVRALVIIYNVTYPKKEPVMKSINFNKEVVIIHGSKILSTYYSQYGRNTISLSVDGNETSYSLFPNQKVMMRSYSYRKNNETSKIGSVELDMNRNVFATNNTKQIMNINCDEYKVTVVTTTKVPLSVPTKNETNIYFYTYNKLNGYEQKYSAYNIDGLVLGADYSIGLGCIQQERSISITEQMVDSSIFDLPQDYKILTYEELYSGKEYKAIRKEINKEIGFGVCSIFKVIFNPLLDILSNPSKTSNNTNYLVKNNMEFDGIDSLKFMIKDTIANSYYYQQQYERLQNKAIRNIDNLSKIDKSGNENTENSQYFKTLNYIQYLQYLMRNIREQAETKGFLIPLSVEESWSN